MYLDWIKSYWIVKKNCSDAINGDSFRCHTGIYPTVCEGTLWLVRWSPVAIYMTVKSYMHDCYPAIVYMDTPSVICDQVIHHSQVLKESCRQIANTFGISKSAVSRIVQRYQKTGSTDTLRKGRCGRPPAMSPADHRALARLSKADPQATAADLRMQLPPNLHQLSLTTIKKSLRLHGRNSYRPVSSPSLNAQQMTCRLNWAKALKNWTPEDWSKVIF